MDFEMFKKVLQEKVRALAKEEMGGGFINEGFFQTEKGKDIIFYPEGGLAGIAVHTMDHYAAFQAGWTMEAVVEAAFSELKERFVEEKEKRLLEQMAVPENIVPVLVSREVNRELLEKIPHIAFQGMEIIFKFVTIPPAAAQMMTKASIPYFHID